MALNYIAVLARKIEAEIAEDARPAAHADELYRLYALLRLVKGADVTLNDVHDAWAVWMSGIDPMHPSLVPFDQLDSDTREEDRTYADAIRTVALTAEQQ